MECPVCKLDRQDKDFYTPEMCYKCQYKIKFSQIVKTKCCRVCYVPISGKKTKYCCEECRKIGVKPLKVHWTKKIINPVVHFTQ